MPFHSIQGQEKPLANLPIRETLGNESEYFQLALAQWFDQRLGRRQIRLAIVLLLLCFKYSQQLTDIVWHNSTSSSFAKQLCHGWTFVHKYADVSLELCKRQGLVQWHESSRDVSLCLVSKRLQFQNFDHTACPSAFFRFFKESLQQSHYLKNGAACMVTLVLGQKYSGQ